MVDDAQNLVIEHLRHIRWRVDRIAEDVADLRLRMSSLETAMVSVKRGKSARVTRPMPGSR